MRQNVPFALLATATLLAACSGSHGRDADADAGPRADGGPAPTDASPAPVDGGGCFESDVSPDILCTGDRYEPIRIWDDGCFCGQELACDTTVDRESPGLIDYAEIDTSAVACGPVCGACMPMDDGCAVPSDLFDGSFAVNVNGWLLPTATNSLTPNTCWTAPPPVGDGTICPDAASGSYAIDGSDLCVPGDARTGAPIEVSVVAAVGCDTHSAGCRAVRTDEGFEITMLARDCDCPTCGACPPEPMPRTFRCSLPPLEPGTYPVRHGSEMATVTVSDGGTGNDLCGEPDV